MEVDEGDYLGSDDLEEVLDRSRRETKPQRPPPVASSSTGGDKQTYLLKPQLSAKLASIDAEVQSIDADIARLLLVKDGLLKERDEVARSLENLAPPRTGNSKALASSKGKAKATAPTTDYTMSNFEWSGELRDRMKQIFGIREFRLCQQGVCNANMDGRDIVCVMPTGGGKSLTYQLPALLTPGCTLVVSPLISLITDQILHLREAGIEAVMLTGGTSKEQSKEIFSRLAACAKGNTQENEIKLCYVTPEKIAKSKVFTSMLEKLATAGKLARIVIDEAHCVSQLGHDFRPDYKKLSILRQLFPSVPILALSATCPPKVLKDLLTTLRLKAVVDGTASPREGTVYFSAPLYRKNLHYQVLPKPASAPAAIKEMAEWILDKHPGESGIVYCLSKKDAESVSNGLSESHNIKTGVYHSDITDAQKEKLHIRWREGQVQVVCATIAFGLGIDKGDVRYVIHHSMSKSLDGFYQESGRAGRDRKDSDCILYFRGQDASRLSSLVCGEIGGTEKVHDMVRFALDKKQCRKVLFANYFSASSSLSLSSWSSTGVLDRCGHCDNCSRSSESLITRDATLEAWSICKVSEEVGRSGGRVSVAMLSDLVRGTKAGGKTEVDLGVVCGGKITGLSRDETETLVIQLVLSGHLEEDFHTTAYSINVYVTPGPQCVRLTRLARDAILKKLPGAVGLVEMAFDAKQPKGKKSRPSASGAASKPASSQPIKRNASLTDMVAAGNARRAAKRQATAVEGKGEAKEEAVEILTDDDDTPGQMARTEVDNFEPDFTRIEEESVDGIAEDSDEEDWEAAGWSFKLLDSAVPLSKPKKRTSSDARLPSSRRKRKTARSNGSEDLDVEVVELSSDCKSSFTLNVLEPSESNIK